MKMRFLAFLFCVFFSFAAMADSELPEEGEIFPSYFARLTRGGAFPGIRLQAGPKFQNEFFLKIQKGHWVGIRNHEINRLTKLGVDIWFDWYRTTKPFALLERHTKTQDPLFFSELSKNMRNICSVEISNIEWAKVGRCEREVLSKAILFQLHDSVGETLLDRLAAQYGLNASDIARATTIFLDEGETFKKRVCEMGYCGEIYFRGITGPDPHNPKRRWIVLNHELMLSMTPFDRPLLQMLEYAGILSHELNHVAQDLAGLQKGLDIQVRDAEAALLIEGMAEFNNQKIWQEFSGNSQPDSPLGLFSAEQGMEVVYREGNSSSGRLFPYTVGLPFVSAFFEYRFKNSSQMQNELLEVLGGERTLTSLLEE